MKISRNQPCPCGSGKKYKKCCLNKLNIGYQLSLKGKNAENFVYQLAQKSFLEDWCYLNPKLPNGKEICDLLVVYDDVAVIWQIKDLKLDDSGKYNPREVQKNLNQISTAKSRLFEKNIQIELENPRRGKEIFNPEPIEKIYTISALLGEEEYHFSFVENIKGQIIHRFTKEFTEIVLRELDTTKDFINYLREKEKLILFNNQIKLFGGEKELLAFYLMHQRSFDKLKEANLSIFDEGLWEELQINPEYLVKKKEDTISYWWDNIINIAHNYGGDYEIVARELARPSRFERRFLSKSFLDAQIKAQDYNKTEKKYTYVILKTDDTTYCFMFMDDVELRTKRTSLLQAICFIARGTYKDNEKVLGIATEMKIQPNYTYDIYLFKPPQWTQQEEDEMKEIQENTGIFINSESE